jgi:hypothetical protein
MTLKIQNEALPLARGGAEKGGVGRRGKNAGPQKTRIPLDA